MLIGLDVRQKGIQLLVNITNWVTVVEPLVGIAKKKQKTVALSSCEAEHEGICATVQEAIFLRQLLPDLFITHVKASPIIEDNQNFIQLCNNPVFHKRSKHMSTKLHYIGKKVEDGSLEIIYQTTEQMATDFFTKAFEGLKFEQHRDYLWKDTRKSLSGGVEVTTELKSKQAWKHHDRKNVWALFMFNSYPVLMRYHLMRASCQIFE